MTAQIKQLHTARIPEFIKTLELLLDEAKEGNISGCLIYYVTKDEYIWCCHNWNAFEAMAALSRLQHHMNTEWDENC